MSYLGQDDNTSCAPISIINAIKWLGYNHNTIDNFRHMCKSRYNVAGTKIEDMSKVIERIGLSREKKESPSIRFLDKILNQGRAAIIVFYGVKSTGAIYGHASFCFGKSGVHYKVVNFFSGIDRPVHHIKRDQMRNMLKFKDKKLDLKSIIWVI